MLTFAVADLPPWLPLLLVLIVVFYGLRLLAIARSDESEPAPAAPSVVESELAALPDWSARAKAVAESSRLPLKEGDPDQRQPNPEKLWLGFDPRNGEAISLDRTQLDKHGHIHGSPGSGKTALGFLPLILQLVRHHHRSPIIVLDLKGEEELFHPIRVECEKSGRSFRYFSSASDKSTYLFNPLAQDNFTALTLREKCEFLLDALHLNHGEGYGKRHFSHQNRLALMQTLRSKQEAQSFEDIQSAIAQELKGHRARDASQLIAEIAATADLPQISLSATSSNLPSGVVEEAISIRRALRNAEVLYFWLPPASGSMTPAHIGQMVLHSLRAAAAARPHGKRDLTYLFIDEFQVMAGANLRSAFEQVRQAGVTIMTATQTRATLQSDRDVDLWPIVGEAAHFRQYFDVEELGLRKELVDLFGTADVLYRSPTIDISRGSVSVREDIRAEPMLDQGFFNWLDAHQDISLLHPRGPARKRHHAIPIVRSEYVCSHDELRATASSPWPTDAPGTFVERDLPPAPPPETLGRGGVAREAQGPWADGEHEEIVRKKRSKRPRRRKPGPKRDEGGSAE